MPNNVFARGVVDDIDIRGLKEAQEAVADLTRRAAVGEGLRPTMNLALLMLQRYALGIVHVDTGRLKNSIFTEIATRGNTLIGYVATNVAYARGEHDRKGVGRDGKGHNFFARAVREEGPRVNDLFAKRLGG